MANLRQCVIDFETVSTVDLKKSGAARYAEDPTTNVICLDFRLDGEWFGTWYPGEDAERFLELVNDPSVTFIAHNASFEKSIWRSIMVPIYSWPNIPNSRWHDSMAVAAMKLLPQDLDMLARVLRLPVQKDMEGNKLIKELSKPDRKGNYPELTPAKIKRIGEYCQRDTETQEHAHRTIGFLPPGERSVWLLDQRINERGVKLDMDFVRAAQEVVDKASVPLTKEFEELTGIPKVTQTAKLKAWCAINGCDLENLQKETLARLLGEEGDEDDDFEESDKPLPELPDDVRRALSIRQLIGSASIKKLARMEACVCADGRARQLLQYHGAGPGRWAGRLLQPQNFPRGTIEIDGAAPNPEDVVAAIMTRDPAYVEMMFGPAVETVVGALRHTIVAEEGRQLLSGDFSTIELRVVLALAGQEDKIKLLAAGLDPYIDMAKKIYKRDDLTKKDNPKERQTGKNSVLGLGFQMGPPKFQFKYAKDDPIEFCKEIVDIYRNEWAPQVPKLWYGLQEAACKAVWDKTPQEAYGVRYQIEGYWLSARLPSGRKLWYPEPTPVRKAMPWDPTDVRPAWTYKAKKLGQWREISAYGGLLTENVVQALARDLMVSAMFQCEKENLPIVLTVHDEIVCEPEVKYADEKALTQIMTAGTAWSKELNIPVATETWTAMRYKK